MTDQRFGTQGPHRLRELDREELDEPGPLRARELGLDSTPARVELATELADLIVHRNENEASRISGMERAEEGADIAPDPTLIASRERRVDPTELSPDDAPVPEVGMVRSNPLDRGHHDPSVTAVERLHDRDLMCIRRLRRRSARKPEHDLAATHHVYPAVPAFVLHLDEIGVAESHKYPHECHLTRMNLRRRHLRVGASRRIGHRRCRAASAQSRHTIMTMPAAFEPSRVRPPTSVTLGR